LLIEMMDMREAQRAMKPIRVIDNARTMMARTVDLLARTRKELINGRSHPFSRDQRYAQAAKWQPQAVPPRRLPRQARRSAICSPAS
jgi:hypothetical protein